MKFHEFIAPGRISHGNWWLLGTIFYPLENDNNDRATDVSTVHSKSIACPTPDELCTPNEISWIYCCKKEKEVTMEKKFTEPKLNHRREKSICILCKCRYECWVSSTSSTAIGSRQPKGLHHMQFIKAELQGFYHHHFDVSSLIKLETIGFFLFQLKWPFTPYSTSFL